MEPSGLFDAPSDRAVAPTAGLPLEQRLDGLAEAAKEGVQLAGKLRTAFGQIEEGAKVGSISTSQNRIARLPDLMREVSSLVGRIGERSVDFEFSGASVADYIHELQAELAKRGVKAAKGPEPYWLVYPAWFKVERGSKGLLEVTLNGEGLDSVRPSVVAAKVAEAVNEKFNAKQFKQLLISVRDLLRRVGANAKSVALDDIYEVLSMGAGRRSSRADDFSKAAFYYSIHRLAETADPALTFPAANRTEAIFFTKDGEGRKYLTVDFTGAS